MHVQDCIWCAYRRMRWRGGGGEVKRERLLGWGVGEREGEQDDVSLISYHVNVRVLEPQCAALKVLNVHVHVHLYIRWLGVA